MKQHLSLVLLLLVVGTECFTEETLVPLSENVVEFASNNSRELSEKWETYYRCQQEKYQQILLNRSSAQIIATAAFEGSRVQLTCDVCLSPQQQDSDIEWNIERNQNIEQLNKTGSHLYFNNLAPHNHGKYLCKFVHLISAVYLLHVLTSQTEPFKQVYLHRDPKPQNDTILTTDLGEVKLNSEWGAWSNCSETHNCGKVGRRIKYGTCMLTPVANKNLQNDLRNILRLFPRGVPCRSLTVPGSIRTMPQVRDRPSEIVLGFCKVSCIGKTDVKFQVWDSKGKQIDSVDNSRGVFSSLQHLPKLPSPPARVYLFPYKGETMTLKCPGDKESDSPIQWHKGHQNITRKQISSKTNERVTIDVLGQVLFKNTYVMDSSIYSCWQEGRLVGTIKVRVMTQEVVMSKLHWSLFISGVVTSCVLLALYRIYKRDIA